MEQGTQKEPTIITLDVVLYRKDGWWIGHCVQLDILTAGENFDKVVQDSIELCEAQILYAMDHDPSFSNLFRPPNRELMQLMSYATATREPFDLKVKASVNEPPPYRVMCRISRAA